MTSRIPRAVKLAAALLLVAAVVAGGPLPRSTALQRSSPLASPEVAGRPAPSTGLVWQTEVAANGYAPADDLVIAAYWAGMAGIEAHTGKIRWQYQPPADFSIVSWGEAAGVVVLAMDTQKVLEPQPEYRWQTVGLEAATGKQLWDQARMELLPIPAYFNVTDVHRLAAGAETILVPWYDIGDDTHLGLAGVDARTGALAWTKPFDRLAIGGVSGCDIIAGGDFAVTTMPLIAANDQTAAVVARCTQGRAVIGFDPRTGTPRWAVPLHAGRPQHLIMDGDAILVGQSGQGTIVDPGGRLVFEGELPPRELVMAVSGDIAVISGQDGANAPLVAVDLRSGQTRWSLPRPGEDEHALHTPNTYRSLTAVNKAILGSRSAAGSAPETPDIEPEPTLLAGVVDVIDPATGTSQSMAMPMVGGSDWVMVVGDLLMLETGRGLAAIRLTPAGTPPTGNAPVSPDRWPDACALVSAEDVQGLSPAGQLTPVKQFATLLGQPIPQPTRCPYADRNGELIFTVAIRWVASDPNTAEAIATTARSLTAGAKWQLYSPEPLIPAVGTWAFGEAANHVTLRVGPVIAEVRSWDVIVPAAEIARLVTERLHALGYQ